MFFFFSGRESNSSDPERLLEEGNRLTESGQLLKALEVFSQYKQMQPLDSRPYFSSGVVLLGMGRFRPAAAEFKEAARLDPEKTGYRIFLAHTLTRLDHKSAARSALAVFQGGDLTELTTAWLWLLSDTYYRLGENADALEVLALLARRTPGDPRISLNQGQVYLALGQYDRARKLIETSIKEQPNDNAVAYYELGNVLRQQNDMEAAREAFGQAVKQHGDNAEYLFKLGTVCLSLGRTEEAIKYLEQAEPLASEVPEIYYSLGRAYQKQGQREEASVYLRKFQEHSAGTRLHEEQEREAEKLVTQGESALEQGTHNEAQALFEQALKVDAGNWAAHGYLAEMLLASGAAGKAYGHLLKMEEIASDSEVGNYLMASYWYERKNLEKARRYAERVRAIRPASAKLRNLLGNIYFGLGLRYEALDEYKAAVRLAPDRPEYRLNLESIRPDELP